MVILVKQWLSGYARVVGTTLADESITGICNSFSFLYWPALFRLDFALLARNRLPCLHGHSFFPLSWLSSQPPCALLCTGLDHFRDHHGGSDLGSDIVRGSRRCTPQLALGNLSMGHVGSTITSIQRGHFADRCNVIRSLHLVLSRQYPATRPNTPYLSSSTRQTSIAEWRDCRVAFSVGGTTGAR